MTNRMILNFDKEDLKRKALLKTPDFIYRLIYGIRNLIKFHKVIWNWRPWDFVYVFPLIQKSLELYLKYGKSYEIDETRIPKEERIKKVIQYLGKLDEADLLEQAEEELGKEIIHKPFKFVPMPHDTELFELILDMTPEEEAHNKEIYDYGDALYQKYWNEVFDIMKKEGQTWWN